ncbi:hypothetical protein Tco_0211193 [Tanacetum coccineum]
MLDKTNYSSWASRMLLYIKGKEHGKLLVDTIINEPFLYGTIIEPRNENTSAFVKARTYTDLTDEENIRESVDIKAINIVLQGSKLSLQERESKLYHDFDMFTSSPGESIHSYYMRFEQLINDMHTIQMTMQPIQVNTKFVNHLQPKWSKFVTDVKLAEDMHSTNFDHLYAHLRQHEAHANEVRLTKQRYPDQIALVANSPSCLNPTQYYPQLSPVTPQYHSRPAPQCSYDAPMVGRVTAQTVQGRQTQGYANSGARSNVTSQGVNKNGGVNTANNEDTFTSAQASQEIPSLAAFQTDDLDAFNSNCDEAPSAKAVLKANLSSYDSNVILEVPFHDTNIKNNMIYQSVQEIQCSEQLSLDNDTEVDITSDSDIISYEQYLQETKNPVVQNTSYPAQQDELLMSIIEEMSSQIAKYNKVQHENKNVIDDRNANVTDFEKQIHSLKLQLNATVESHKALSTTVECLKKESKDKEDKYLDEVIDLQKKNKSLDNVVYKIARRKVPALYDDHTIVKQHDDLSVPGTKETLDLAEESRQPSSFKSERPKFSKPRFASQVDINNDLPKPITPHHLPKVRESVLEKPHHVIAPSSSRNSQEESNDMAHNYFIDKARKTTQERNRNLKPREMPSARTHHTPIACKPKLRSNNQTSKNCVASPVLVVVAPEPANPSCTPSSTFINQDAPSQSNSQNPKESQSPVISPVVKEQFHDIEVAHLDNDPFFSVPIP